MELKFFLWVPTVIAYMIKKELDVYLRVPGSSDQNTGLDITLPTGKLPWAVKHWFIQILKEMDDPSWIP